jgi:hypothetical protein
MIRYSLVCDAGHGFEGWFAGSDGFDAQLRRGLIACPHCQSVRVEKAIMAPSVVRTDHERRNINLSEAAELPVAAGGMLPASDLAHDLAPVALLNPEAQARRAAIRALHALVLDSSENVGPRFAQEARAMHEGETETRSIHGQASLEEVRALLEDGIEALPIPVLPEDRN